MSCQNYYYYKDPCRSCYNTCCIPQCNNLSYNHCQPTVSCISYETISATSTPISSGDPNVAPSPIPPASTSIPPGTLTALTGFTATPLVNCGGISYNNSNGQFTIPVAGNYLISAYVGFSANAVGMRQVYLYKVDAITNIISLLVTESQNATVVGPTFITLTTNAQLNKGDRVFVAVAHNSGEYSLNTISDNRFSLVKVC